MKVFLALVLCFAMRAAEGPRIVEAESRLELRAGTAALKIGVESAQAVRGARVTVEWLDPSDEVVTSGSATVALVRGINHVTLALPSPAAKVDPDDHDELIWHRLRCRVELPGGAPAVQQIVSVSRIDSNLFALQILGVHGEDGFVSVFVRTVHPVSERPAAGVAVTARLNKVTSATGTTTGDGTVRLRVPLVDKAEGDEHEVEVTARLGDLIQEGQQYVEIDRAYRMLVRTDKEIYQPGQRLRMRGIARQVSGRVAPNAAIEVTVSRGDHNLFRTQIRTSRFGVWAAEWVIPEGAETGSYSVKAEMEVRGVGPMSGVEVIEVSRYELPSFSVAAKLVKPWYLMGQDAMVEPGQALRLACDRRARRR